MAVDDWTKKHMCFKLSEYRMSRDITSNFMLTLTLVKNDFYCFVMNRTEGRSGVPDCQTGGPGHPSANCYSEM